MYVLWVHCHECAEHEHAKCELYEHERAKRERAERKRARHERAMACQSLFNLDLLILCIHHFGIKLTKSFNLAAM